MCNLPNLTRYPVPVRIIWHLFFIVSLLLVSSRFASQPAVHAKSNTPLASASIHAETPPPHSGCRIIYAGFVGALETSNHKGSGVVQIRDILRGAEYPDVCANSFIPISWSSGREWILTYFPSHAGVLTPDELQSAPRIILVGHSTGGWAMLSVARDLRDKNIPVELTVQIDSVGVTDYTIPRNVSSGAIFHAWDALMFMTTKKLRVEDPLHTKIIANIVVKNASHLSITRDPRIRQLVMDAVARLRLHSAAQSAIAGQ